MPIAKEQIRQIISQNGINSVADVNSLLKDSFKEILHDQLRNLYRIEMSTDMVSKITVS